MKYELHEIRNLYYELFAQGISNVTQVNRWAKCFEQDLKDIGCGFNFELYYSTNFDVVSAVGSPNGDNKRYDLFEFIYQYFNPKGVYLLESERFSII